MNKSAMTIRRIVISGLLLSGVLTLQGCIEAVILGGAASGVLVISDRRQPDVMASDERIEIQIGQRLSDQFKTAHINTISYNKMVLLTGEVANAAAKAQAEKIAQSISEVRSVVNELQIGPASSFGNRGNDSFISGKVKAAFISHAKFQPNHVKVITEGGVSAWLGDPWRSRDGNRDRPHRWWRSKSGAGVRIHCCAACQRGTRRGWR